MKTVLDYISTFHQNSNLMIFVLISFIGDSCQYWMDLENWRLSSPYYPERYFADGNNCEWVITAPLNLTISM